MSFPSGCALLSGELLNCHSHHSHHDCIGNGAWISLYMFHKIWPSKLTPAQNCTKTTNTLQCIPLFFSQQIAPFHFRWLWKTCSMSLCAIKACCAKSATSFTTLARKRGSLEVSRNLWGINLKITGLPGSSPPPPNYLWRKTGNKIFLREEDHSIPDDNLIRSY